MSYTKVTLVCVALVCGLVQINLCETNIRNMTMNNSMVLKENDTTLVERTTDQECNCGEGSTGCDIRDGEIVCNCKTGYLQDMTGFCRECNCGTHGNCTFEIITGFLRKDCDCFFGYVEFGGLCKECSCGVKGNCTFDHRGLKKCKCEFGYGEASGTCTPCGCNPDDKCSFDPISGRCHCLQGYEDRKGLCKDVNECLNPEICPTSSKCINTIGSYDCECKKGYERPSGHFNPKKDECQDIDECLTLDMPCLYEFTTCVNIPGSYRCDCRSGYQPLISPIDPKQSPKYNDCIEDTSYSKSIAIVVGCLCGAIIIVLLIIVQYKGRRR